MKQEQIEQLLEEFPDWGTSSGVRELIEAAYQLGWERGKDYGEESMRSWLQGGYE